MSLPSVAPYSGVSDVLRSKRNVVETYVFTLHHREVISAHYSVFEVLLGKKLRPAIVIKDGAVVEQPLHGRWIFTLSWGWPRVIWVGAHSIGAPDS